MPDPKKIEALLKELEASISREAFWISRGEMEAVQEALPNKEAIIRVLLGFRQDLGAAAWSATGYESRLVELARRHQKNVNAHQAWLEKVRLELDNVAAIEGRLKRADGIKPREPSRSAVLWA